MATRQDTHKTEQSTRAKVRPGHAPEGNLSVKAWGKYVFLCLGIMLMLSLQSLAEPHVQLPQSRLPKPGVQTATRPAAPQPTFMIKGIPDAMQMNNYSCGVGVFQAVAMYFGHWGYQDEFAKLLDTSAENGTHPGKIVKGFKKLGLVAEMGENLTIDELKKRLKAGDMVIIDYQAWCEEPENHDYANDWENGHYSLLVGFNDQVLFIEDPSLFGTVGYLTNDEFMARWRDYEIENGKRRNYVQMAIFIKGKAEPQPAFTHID